VSSAQVDAIEAGVYEQRLRQQRFPKICSTRKCQRTSPLALEGAVEVSVRQIGAREIRVTKVGALKHRTPKQRSRQFCSLQIGLEQDSIIQVAAG
jgi:hypothetical protein